MPKPGDKCEGRPEGTSAPPAALCSPAWRSAPRLAGAQEFVPISCAAASRMGELLELEVCHL
jgi:hypothetical protein